VQDQAVKPWPHKIPTCTQVFEKFGPDLDKSTIIQIWKEKSTLNKVVAGGFRAILSNNDRWYLDNTNITWDQFYNNEPFEAITDPTQQALVLGGEAAAWAEQIDQGDLDSTIWPRAAAAAEKLWSPR
jgi:hexosaminidase